MMRAGVLKAIPPIPLFAAGGGKIRRGGPLLVPAFFSSATHPLRSRGSNEKQAPPTTQCLRAVPHETLVRVPRVIPERISGFGEPFALF